MNTTQTTSFNLALASASKDAWNAYAPKIGLFKNDVEPQPNMTLDTFVEADYTGYARLGTTFGPVFIDNVGQPTSICNREFYSDPAGTIEQTLYGAFMLNTLTGVLAAARFPNTRPMGLPAQALPMQMVLHNGILTLSEQL